MEAGCDEAGRGCLAGPVVAATVIFPKEYTNNQLNDSKLLTERNRHLLRQIIHNDALAFGIGMATNNEIDSLNILNASFLAMHRAIAQLTCTPELLLIDGNRFNAYPNIPHQCIVKGDQQYLSIAAASILAKTYRDELMTELSSHFTEYEWKQNKGYPTVAHRKAIIKYGLSTFHRKTFTVKRP